MGAQIFLLRGKAYKLDQSKSTQNEFSNIFSNDGDAADSKHDAGDEEKLRASVSEFGCCQ